MKRHSGTVPTAQDRSNASVLQKQTHARTHAASVAVHAAVYNAACVAACVAVYLAVSGACGEV